MSAKNVKSKADLGQLLLLLQKQVAYIVQLRGHRSAGLCSCTFSKHIYCSAGFILMLWSFECKLS